MWIGRYLGTRARLESGGALRAGGEWRTCGQGARPSRRRGRWRRRPSRRPPQSPAAPKLPAFYFLTSLKKSRNSINEIKGSKVHHKRNAGRWSVPKFSSTKNQVMDIFDGDSIYSIIRCQDDFVIKRKVPKSQYQGHKGVRFEHYLNNNINYLCQYRADISLFCVSALHHYCKTCAQNKYYVH